MGLVGRVPSACNGGVLQPGADPQERILVDSVEEKPFAAMLRYWVLSGPVALWSSALVDQMTIHILVQDAGDKCLVGNAFF